MSSRMMVGCVGLVISVALTAASYFVTKSVFVPANYQSGSVVLPSASLERGFPLTYYKQAQATFYVGAISVPDKTPKKDYKNLMGDVLIWAVIATGLLKASQILRSKHA